MNKGRRTMVRVVMSRSNNVLRKFAMFVHGSGAGTEETLLGRVP
jgi:hypothetical protein